MKKTAKKTHASEAKNHFILQLSQIIRHDLHALVVEQGVAAFQALLEQERTLACGERYLHQTERRAYRNGHAMGELSMGGRRVSVKRPRARSVDGDEVVLPSWDTFSDNDLILLRFSRHPEQRL